MNINKIIHEAMGEKWHERGGKDEDGDVVCSCGGWWPEHDRLNICYTDPIHYCELMDWMSINYRSRKIQVYCNNNPDIEPVDIQEWLVLSRQEQVSLIAEAIIEGVLQ